MGLCATKEKRVMTRYEAWLEVLRDMHLCSPRVGRRIPNEHICVTHSPQPNSEPLPELPVDRVLRVDQI